MLKRLHPVTVSSWRLYNLIYHVADNQLAFVFRITIKKIVTEKCNFFFSSQNTIAPMAIVSCDFCKQNASVLSLLFKIHSRHNNSCLVIAWMKFDFFSMSNAPKWTKNLNISKYILNTVKWKRTKQDGKHKISSHWSLENTLHSWSHLMSFNMTRIHSHSNTLHYLCGFVHGSS